MRTLVIFAFFYFCFAANLSAQSFRLRGTVSDSSNLAIPNVELFVQELVPNKSSDKKGNFIFDGLAPGNYSLLVLKDGFTSQTLAFSIDNKDLVLNIILKPFEFQTREVIVSDDNANYGLDHFRAVDWDNMVIGAAKKSEIIRLDKIEGNLAANNSRQIYAKVAGLNIWENDNSGIQLNIGGRGLSPNRTSNFNTRQNGYDISADALGYPESYYTPPAQALEQIELIRGAASLQYGTQFGGLLNFRIKQGAKDSPFNFVSENTYSSFNFFNSFNSVGGTVAKNKLNYYAYYQYKRGDGWRPFSEFEVHNGYAALEYRINDKLKINFEQTSMRYLARQPGGLTDIEFSQDPRQSERPRNWFKVNWNISSLSIDYRISEKTKINIRNFGLWAERQSLGNLTPINRVDYGGPRDLIRGAYHNIGNETRVLHRYKIAGNTSVALGGLRLYKGFTEQAQGYSNSDSTGSSVDFSFSSAQSILRSDYRFPSFNAALFAENYFTLGKHFSITPGIRYEFISTSAKGYYQDLVVVPSNNGFDTLRNEAIYENRNLPRSVFLAGLGASYRPKESLEIYANFSQNYRAVNFNDMRIINPNQEVDLNLEDESGFNADLGFRGKWKSFLNFDLSLFYLSYNNRIGNLQVQRPDPENTTILQLITLRSNIGNARVFGFESLVEWDIWQTLCKKPCAHGLIVFANFAWLDGRYLKNENSFAAGKKLELVPTLTLKTGMTLYFKDLRFNYQFSYTSAHYSDATNAEQSPNAVVGIIPAYYVMDASFSYSWRWFKLQAGVNNMLNIHYFTRRAASYPGPGILPGDARSFYIGLRTELSVKPIKK